MDNKTLSLILSIICLFTGCEAAKPNGSSVDRAVDEKEVRYCDIVAAPERFDGKTVILTGTIYFTLTDGEWLIGPECLDHDANAAVIFPANKQVEDFLIKNSWLTTKRQLTSMNVKVRAKFLNSPPDKSRTNLLTNYHVFIEEVLESGESITIF